MMNFFPGIYIMILGSIVSASAFAQEQPETMPAPTVPLIPVENEPSAPVNNEAAQDSEIKNIKIPKSVSEMQSFLLSESDLRSIRSARKAYEQSVKTGGKAEFSESDFLKKLENVTSVKLESNDSFTYPQFFLSSIAYYSENDWVVWINNEKITQDTATSQSGLVVKYIDSEKVGFEWTPEHMDKIADNNEYSEENPIKVSAARGTVEFFLKPHQTFSTYAMQIVEGKLQPVTVKIGGGSIINKLIDKKE